MDTGKLPGISLVRLVTAQISAVVGITALLAGLFAWLGPDSGDRTIDAAVRSTPTSSAVVAAPPVSKAPSVVPSTTAGPVRAQPTTAAAGKRQAVVVLNQSSRAGAAEKVAWRLRAAGWSVSRVGNFSGTVSTTTVYYPAGLESFARALAAVLPGEPRVRKRFAGLSSTRLTVILTRDYPG